MEQPNDTPHQIVNQLIREGTQLVSDAVTLLTRESNTHSIKLLIEEKINEIKTLDTDSYGDDEIGKLQGILSLLHTMNGMIEAGSQSAYHSEILRLNKLYHDQ